MKISAWKMFRTLLEQIAKLRDIWQDENARQILDIVKNDLSANRLRQILAEKELKAALIPISEAFKSMNKDTSHADGFA